MSNTGRGSGFNPPHIKLRSYATGAAGELTEILGNRVSLATNAARLALTH